MKPDTGYKRPDIRYNPIQYTKIEEEGRIYDLYKSMCTKHFFYTEV